MSLIKMMKLNGHVMGNSVSLKLDGRDDVDVVIMNRMFRQF